MSTPWLIVIMHPTGSHLLIAMGIPVEDDDDVDSDDSSSHPDPDDDTRDDNNDGYDANDDDSDNNNGYAPYLPMNNGAPITGVYPIAGVHAADNAGADGDG